jgi:hypothetical protein
VQPAQNTARPRVIDKHLEFIRDFLANVVSRSLELNFATLPEALMLKMQILDQSCPKNALQIWKK